MILVRITSHNSKGAGWSNFAYRSGLLHSGILRPGLATHDLIRRLIRTTCEDSIGTVGLAAVPPELLQALGSRMVSPPAPVSRWPCRSGELPFVSCPIGVLAVGLSAPIARTLPLPERRLRAAC